MPRDGPVAVCQSGPVPRFEPFQGLRYRPEVAPIAQVIAPPYDVISATERAHLASRHPANAVLVELPEADLSAGRDRYAVATDLFTRWQADGIIVADPDASLYPYRMTDTRAAPPPASSGRSGWPSRARRATSSRTSRPCPSPRATAWTSCGPPGPTCRPSGASPWPRA